MHRYVSLVAESMWLSAQHSLCGNLGGGSGVPADCVVTSGLRVAYRHDGWNVVTRKGRVQSHGE